MEAFYSTLLRHGAPRRLRARAARPPRRSRARASASPRSSDWDTDCYDLRPQRHRGDQPRGLRLGPRARRRGRRGAHHGDGAPLEHRPLAAAVRGDGREAALPVGVRRRRAVAGRAGLGARRGPGQARGRRPRVERARHDQPGGGDRAPRPRRRRGDARRRRPGGAPDAGGPAGDRRRLLRLDRPQGARARPVGHAPRPPRAAEADAPVPRRRPHDLPRGARALDLERAALEVRGRHLGDGRGRGPRARPWTT